MTKLKLLGAQRVKALSEILERKFDDEIKTIRAKRRTSEEATFILAEQKGLSEQLSEAMELGDKLNNLSRPLLRELGIKIEAVSESNHYLASSAVRDNLRKIIDDGTEGKIRKVKRELEERKSQLWLVETLDEAQDIVSRPIEY